MVIALTRATSTAANVLTAGKGPTVLKTSTTVKSNLARLVMEHVKIRALRSSRASARRAGADRYVNVTF